MGKNVAISELEFYIKLFKRHTEELLWLINEKMSWFLCIFLKSHMYKRYLISDCSLHDCWGYW